MSSFSKWTRSTRLCFYRSLKPTRIRMVLTFLILLFVFLLLSVELIPKSKRLLPPPGVILPHSSGIGNQLFRFACTYTLSKTLGWPLYIWNNKSLTGRHFNSNQREFALDQFSIPNLQVLKPGTRLEGRVYRVGDKELFTGQIPANATKGMNFLYFKGYCQAPLYWQNYTQEIFRMFQPSASVRNSLTPAFRTILDEMRLIDASESVAVHVRRGDFLTKGYTSMVPIAHQRVAMRRLAKLFQAEKVRSPVFLVFSNDMEYVKEAFADFQEKWRIVFVSDKSTTSLQDFYLMMRCKHFIVSVSTFSYWAAMLGAYENKTVMASIHNPMWIKFIEKHWMTNGTTNNYYPSDWILINVFSGELG